MWQRCTSFRESSFLILKTPGKKYCEENKIWQRIYLQMRVQTFFFNFYLFYFILFVRVSKSARALWFSLRIKNVLDITRL